MNLLDALLTNKPILRSSWTSPIDPDQGIPPMTKDDMLALDWENLPPQSQVKQTDLKEAWDKLIAPNLSPGVDGKALFDQAAKAMGMSE